MTERTIVQAAAGYALWLSLSQNIVIFVARSVYMHECTCTCTWFSSSVYTYMLCNSVLTNTPTVVKLGNVYLHECVNDSISVRHAITDVEYTLSHYSQYRRDRLFEHSQPGYFVLPASHYLLIVYM